MYKLHFCSQKECQKCIFQQSGDVYIKNFPFGANHGSTSQRQLTKRTVKKINLWGKTAVHRSVWVKACTPILLLFIPSSCPTKMVNKTILCSTMIFIYYAEKEQWNTMRRFTFFIIFIIIIFFNCYLAAPWPTLGHSQRDSLTNPMLITAFYLC